MAIRDLLLLFPLISGVLAHGKLLIPAELAARDTFLATRSEPMSFCKREMKSRGLLQDAAIRRMGWATAIREERGLDPEANFEQLKRDLSDAMEKDHTTNLTGLSWDTDPTKLFMSDKSCLLTPEVTEGPYYVAGEYIRPNVVENQPGVPLYLDVQLFDVNTCEPLKDSFFEIWQTNATGVYSGVHAQGNGNYADDGNEKTTFLRGMQQADDKGVVQFQTIFPGHYPGRAIHIHILAHIGATAQPNGTITGGHVSHVGQIFFDQTLIAQVDKTLPYSTNDSPLTLNEDDGIAEDQAKHSYDPFAEYAMLGKDVTQGLLAWITVGVDPKEEIKVYVAGKVAGQATTTTGVEQIVAPPTGTAESGPTGTMGKKSEAVASLGGSALGAVLPFLAWLLL